MRGAWTIALREIGERRVFLLAALVAGLFPFASPLFPGVRAGDWADARDIGALAVSVLFGAGCALLLGATIIGRDLAEHRLSFDFARPVGSGGIWAGRLGGALGLSVLALGLALLPVTVLGGGPFSASVGPMVRGVALAAVAAMLVLIPLAHVAGVALRSRSGWLAVDLAAAGVLVVLVGGMGRLLYDAFALQLLIRAAIVLGVLAVPAVWIASATQVVVGRTDPRRGHRAQACTLWGILLGLALLFTAFVGWVFMASPRDLLWVVSRGAPRGPWVAVTGEAKNRGDYAPLFLIDTASGRDIGLGAFLPLENSLRVPVLFSRDGRRAVVFHVESPRDLRTQVSVVDLDDPAGGRHDTNIVFPNPWRQVALSEDGARLAVLAEGTLSVVDLNTGATLAAVNAIEAGRWASVLFFVSSDRVRVVAVGETTSIDELCISTRALERHTDLAKWEKMSEVAWDRTHDRYLLQASRTALLSDGRTGAPIRELTCAARDNCTWDLLADGRIVAREGGHSALRLLSADGDDIGVIQPPTPGVARFVRELDPGRLVVRVDSDEHRSSVKAYIVDLATGSWSALPEDLEPSVKRNWSLGLSSSEPGSVAAHLFNSKGSLVLYDPATGSRRVIAGRE